MFKLNNPTLILVRGLPGSGKSTLAKMFLSDIYHYEADMYFTDAYGVYTFDPSKIGNAHFWCRGMVCDKLQKGFSVCVTNTSTTEKEVNEYIKIAYDYNANFISLIAENRHGTKDIHNVPSEKIQQMKDRFSVKL